MNVWSFVIEAEMLTYELSSCKHTHTHIPSPMSLQADQRSLWLLVTQKALSSEYTPLENTMHMSDISRLLTPTAITI